MSSLTDLEDVDGGSGQVIGEFADHRYGKKYDVDLSKSVPGATKQWLNGYMDSFTSWSYAKRAFDLWAHLFRHRFDELRASNPKK